MHNIVKMKIILVVFLVQTLVPGRKNEFQNHAKCKQDNWTWQVLT